METYKTLGSNKAIVICDKHMYNPCKNQSQSKTYHNKIIFIYTINQE